MYASVNEKAKKKTRDSQSDCDAGNLPCSLNLLVQVDVFLRILGQICRPALKHRSLQRGILPQDRPELLRIRAKEHVHQVRQEAGRPPLHRLRGGPLDEGIGTALRLLEDELHRLQEDDELGDTRVRIPRRLQLPQRQDLHRRQLEDFRGDVDPAQPEDLLV
ncbi:hypothetical protein VTN96DRAFT_2821 [Rasamsonia emersonii]